MRLESVVPALLLAAVAVSGCGGSVNAPASPTTSAAIQEEAQFVGKCGARSDAEIAAAVGAAELTRVLADPLTCRWEAGDVAVTFKWLRGSVLADYRHEVAGTRTDTQVEGRAGYRWHTATDCEFAVGTGAAEFIAWKVEHAPVDLCAAVALLAASTLRG